MGRPTDLTPEIQRAIVAAVEAGNAGEIAAMAQGVEARTFYAWMARGKKGEEPFAQFRQAVTRARAAAETYAVSCLRAGMADDPKFAVEFLKRQRWKRWQDRQRVETKQAPDKMPTAALLAEYEAELERAKARMPN